MSQNISIPRTLVPLVPAAPAPTVAPKITTFIGQKLAAGTASAGVLLKDVDIYDTATLFGNGSMLSDMLKNWKLINQGVSQVDVIALEDNGAGVAAAGAIVFTGTSATAAGTYTVKIGNDYNEYTIDVSAADTPTIIGAALTAAITADVHSLVTAINTTGSVALTAKNDGTVGNGIGIQLSGTVAGISVALTAMTAGATNPAMTGLADLLVDRTDIVMPYEFGISTFVTHLDDNFNVDNKSMDGRLFTAKVDTKANLVTLGNAENSESLIVWGDKPVSKATKKGGAIFAMPYAVASQFAALRALRLEIDPVQIITDFVVTTELNDQMSGAHTNALPYHNSPLQLPVIPSGEGFTDIEVADLTAAHVSVVGNNLANNGIISGVVYTTYKTNAQGVADPSFGRLNYVDTASASREFIQNRLKSDYAQRRLTAGQGVAGYAFADADIIRASMVEYYTILSGEGYVLLQQGAHFATGKQFVDYYKDYLTVTISTVNGTATIGSILPIVTQLETIICPLKINFDPRSV